MYYHTHALVCIFSVRYYFTLNNILWPISYGIKLNTVFSRIQMAVRIRNSKLL